jgi:Transposase DDE domain
MAQIADEGGYWFSRLHARPKVHTTEGILLDVCVWLDQLRDERYDQAEVGVLLGDAMRLPARLLALRVPAQLAEQRRRRLHSEAQKRGQSPSSKQLAWADWTLYVTKETNVTKEQLSIQEAALLGKSRWQIELLFKQWKSDRQVDEWRSANPWRILCEVYAKLIGSVVTHWLTVVGCWASPNRSMRKAGQAIQLQAIHLASCLPLTEQLVCAIKGVQRSLQAGCRLNKRRRHPNTYQLLLNPALFPLA